MADEGTWAKEHGHWTLTVMDPLYPEAGGTQWVLIKQDPRPPHMPKGWYAVEKIEFSDGTTHSYGGRSVDTTDLKKAKKAVEKMAGLRGNPSTKKRVPKPRATPPAAFPVFLGTKYGEVEFFADRLKRYYISMDGSTGYWDGQNFGIGLFTSGVKATPGNYELTRVGRSLVYGANKKAKKKSTRKKNPKKKVSVRSLVAKALK